MAGKIGMEVVRGTFGERFGDFASEEVGEAK